MSTLVGVFPDPFNSDWRAVMPQWAIIKLDRASGPDAPVKWRDAFITAIDYESHLRVLLRHETDPGSYWAINLARPPYGAKV